MRMLWRAPLLWMVLAEIAVVGALILVAWHAIAGASASGGPSPFTFPFAPASASPADTALPGAGVPVVDTNTRGPAPGLNLGIGFWRGRLARLNRDQAEFEALEWKLTHSVMDAAPASPGAGRAPGGRACRKGGSLDAAWDYFCSGAMVTLPLSVAPSSTVSRATLTSPLRRPDPPSVRRRRDAPLPFAWPRTLTFEPSIVAWMLAVLSTVTSPLALSSPSTLPWTLRSPWMSRRPCRLSPGPRLTRLVPPFGVVAGADFSAWAIWASSTTCSSISLVLLNSDGQLDLRIDAYLGRVGN